MKKSEKLYRLAVWVLTIILVLTVLPTAKSFFNQQKITSHNKLIVNTKANGNIEAINTIDNTILKVKYTKDIDEYSLYRDDIEYGLDVTKYGNDLVIDLGEAQPLNYDGIVIGQCPLVIPLILWTPALIEAAQITIAATIAVVGTYTLWYSVDSIAKTIDTTSAQVKVQEKEKTKKSTGYYSAALAGSKVVISNQITYEQAVARLIAGMDVFATSKIAASAAAFAATAPPSKLIYHLAHDTGDGFYPHYHPGGRKWIMNPNHEPHCWFGATP
jgi:hypothetical protein